MPAVLTFRLYAPLGAMGSVAMGNRRDSWSRPAHAAIFGLIGACLGIERTDEPALQRLGRDYCMGMLIEHVGPPMIDFHTAQAPPDSKRRSYMTRAEELHNPLGLATVVTYRTYHSDILVLVAIQPVGEAPGWSLGEISRAMRTPIFTPYLGRKSCPLGMPLSPQIGEAPNLVVALRTRRASAVEVTVRDRLLPRVRRVTEIALASQDVPAGAVILREERRRDRCESRARWQFGLRDEAILSGDVDPCS